MSSSPNSPQTPSSGSTSSSAPPTPPAPDPGSALRGVPFDISTVTPDADQKSKWSPAWIAVAGGLAVFALFFWAYSLGARAQRPMPLGPVTSQNTAVATVRVYVDGAVSHPGVYSLPTDARVSDALSAAGGTLPGADSSSLNLAAFVQDGAKISVPVGITSTPPPIVPPVVAPTTAPPSTAPIVPSPVTAPATLSPSPSATLSPAMATRTATSLELRANPLDLNTATSEQLQQLPGVGPAMAQRILDYRTQSGRFNSVADLDNVKGIGQKRMDEFKDMVVVR